LTDEKKIIIISLSMSYAKLGKWGTAGGRLREAQQKKITVKKSSAAEW
jgi:hypothetical protein